MTTDTALMRTSAVDPEVAAAIAMYERMQPLQNALGIGDLNVGEMQLFAMVAHRTGLDPFTRQIYAIKRAGKVTHQTGIDGYRSVAERTREYAGSDEAAYEPCTCGKPPAEHPAVARVTVHRILAGGHVVGQVGVARWHELYPGDGPVGAMWQKMPFNQLAKCAEANALRKAFPRVLEGVYVTEEMEQAGPAQNGELAAAAAKPTAGERIAARRQAVEATVIVVEPMGDLAGAFADAPPADAEDPGPAGPTPPAPGGGSLATLLRDTASGSSLAGPMTEPQRKALADALEPLGRDVMAAGLRVAFGDVTNAEGKIVLTSAQANAVIAAAGDEAFLDRWRAMTEGAGVPA
jgi:phage recombination protein Bet